MEYELQRMYWSGLSLKEIEAQTSIPYNKVHRILKSVGTVFRRPGRKLTAFKEANI